MHWIFLALLQFTLFAADFDCIVIGSSPFSLFEALYQSHSGKRVLILEEADECGGAWKGINVCGIMHADLGCHLVGHDLRLKTFLEQYAGCTIVSMDHPQLPFHSENSPNGWYFAHGCYELIDNLLKLIQATDIVLLTNTRAQTVVVDALQGGATVETKDRSYTTEKVIATPMTSFNLQPNSAPPTDRKLKYYHLYLLLQDPTPPRFSYYGSVQQGVSRVMNLTHFVGLMGAGRQLIVIQTHNEQLLSQGEALLDGLKRSNLVDPGAYILQAETYIYESGLIPQVGAQGLVDVLRTNHFNNLLSYISKWETVLKPFAQQ